MKRNNFSKAEQGKFYRPVEELEIPLYLDKERLLQKSKNDRLCHGELVEPYNEINDLQAPFDKLRVTMGDFCKSL